MQKKSKVENWITPVQFEEGVTIMLASRLRCTYGDAAGIVEANQKLVDDAYGAMTISHTVHQILKNTQL